MAFGVVRGGTTDSRRVVLIVSLVAMSGLTIALGVIDPTAPVFGVWHSSCPCS
jgi:hypothetical protein